MSTKTRGFPLVELLVVVAIIAVLVAIAVPALTSSVQRARQKRTVAELHQLATAASSYATDCPFLPKVGPSHADLPIPYLEPTDVRHLASVDGWRQPIRYEAVGLSYTLPTLDADGVAQASLALGPPTNFADDLVIANGVFVQWPDGLQRNESAAPRHRGRPQVTSSVTARGTNETSTWHSPC